MEEHEVVEGKYSLLELKTASTKFVKKLEAEISKNKAQLSHMVNVGGTALNKADPILRLYLVLKRNCTSLLHHAHQHESLPSGSAMDNKLIELVSTFNNDKEQQMEIVLQLLTLFDQCVFYLCNLHNMSAGMVSLSGRTELRHSNNNNNINEGSEEDDSFGSSDGGTASKGIRELVQLAMTFKGFEKIVRVVCDIHPIIPISLTYLLILFI